MAAVRLSRLTTGYADGIVLGVLRFFPRGNLVLSLGVDHEAMAQEIKPDEIRKANLNRRLRGYDRQETEQLLADVAESYAKVLSEREALSEQLKTLQQEQAERDRDGRDKLERLHERLSKREGRVSDLEAQVARLEEKGSNQLEDTSCLTAELAIAQAAEARQASELVAQRESLARLETRERALLEQIAMLEAQLEQVDDTEATTADPGAIAHLEERAARTLLRLDHLVERAQRKRHRDAEIMLTKARERVQEIVRLTETELQPSAEDPVTGGSQDEGEKEELGEAAWVSQIGSDQIRQRSSS
jgi:DNA repair exonuclease SbcCD ATPase subunit